MKREDAIQNLIDDIMDSFDVERCIKVMEFLDWKWGDSEDPPSDYEFRRELRRALKEAVKHGGYVSGGFDLRFYDSVDEETGEPFIRFSGGFSIEDVYTFDGISYKKGESE